MARLRYCQPQRSLSFGSFSLGSSKASTLLFGIIKPQALNIRRAAFDQVLRLG